MSGVIKFYEEVYNAPIYFICDVDVKTAKELLKKSGIDVGEEPWGVAHTYAVTENENTQYVTYVSNMKDLERFAHEIVHLVGFILSDRGLKYDQENDEPFAYLAEHLFKKLTDALKDEK